MTSPSFRPNCCAKDGWTKSSTLICPPTEERAEIFRIHLAKRNRRPEDFDFPALVAASQDYSGAEIEEAIISALYDAFYTRQELATAHVLAALNQTVPMAKTMAEKIAAQRNWASGRARNASIPRVVKERQEVPREEPRFQGLR